MMLVSFQRYVTLHKILNLKQSLRFPSRPRVFYAGVELMQQLLCEAKLEWTRAYSVLWPGLIQLSQKSGRADAFRMGNNGTDLTKVS